jgi:four helix bundle protein
MGTYKELIVFQKADELAFQIYKITDLFPKEELYGLTSQIRRSALSVPTNIVEGHARRSKKEFKQFVNISLGSLAETRYLYDFSKRLGYHKKDNSEIACLIEEVGRILWSFYQSI